MSLRGRLTAAGIALGIVFTFGAAAAFAQQPLPPQQDGARQQMPEGRGGKRRGPGMRGHGPLRLLRELNLTDAQREQIRAIHERAETATNAQRQELRSIRESNQGGVPSADTQARARALRNEIEQAMRNTHQEVLNVLTAEQRTQLEQRLKEQKARHEERRGRRMSQPDNQ